MTKEGALRKIRIAFQGGGAAFAGMLPVAQAIYDLSKEPEETEIIVDRVSGSSAGAIAAAILASGVDPRRFKNWLLSNRKDSLSNGEYWKQKVTPPNRILLYLRLLLGYPVCSFRTLEEFIQDMFEGVFRELSDDDRERAERNIYEKCKICVVDLRAVSPRMFWSEDNDNTLPSIRERQEYWKIIAKSCAVPIVFKTHRSGEDDAYEVDGGTMQNIPLSILLEDRFPRNDVFASVFPLSERHKTAKNLREYLQLLISNLVFGNMQNDIGVIPTANIIKIKYEYDTIDLGAALNFLRDEYDDHLGALLPDIRRQLVTPTNISAVLSNKIKELPNEKIIDSGVDYAPRVLRFSDRLPNLIDGDIFEVEITDAFEIFSVNEVRDGNDFDVCRRIYNIRRKPRKSWPDVAVCRVSFPIPEEHHGKAYLSVSAVDNNGSPVQFTPIITKNTKRKDASVSKEVILFFELDGAHRRDFNEIEITQRTIIDTIFSRDSHMYSGVEKLYGFQEPFEFFFNREYNFNKYKVFFVIGRGNGQGVDITPRAEPANYGYDATHLNVDSYLLPDMRPATKEEIEKIVGYGSRRYCIGWCSVGEKIKKNDYFGFDVSIRI